MPGNVGWNKEQQKNSAILNRCFILVGEGVAHTITQTEGCEQRDPLMPALFSLGVHPTLQALQTQLQEDERSCRMRSSSMRPSTSTMGKQKYGSMTALCRVASM